MGSEHHFTPVFITKAFAGSAALDLLPAGNQRARERYLRALAPGGSSRDRLVVEIEKRPAGNRVICRPTQSVCVARHLYSLPAEADPVRRGIATWLIASSIGMALDRPANDGDVLRWAEAVGQLNVARTCVEDLVSKGIDGPMVQVVDELRKTAALKPSMREPASRFLNFARIRTPFWYETNRRGMFAQTYYGLGKYGPIPVLPKHFEAVQRFLEIHAAVAADTAYPCLLAAFANSRDVPRVAHRDFRYTLYDASHAGVPFVTCDNPARPFDRSGPEKAYKRPVQGFRLPTTTLVYPISPWLALGLSADRTMVDYSTIAPTRQQVRAINTALLMHADAEVVLPDHTEALFLRDDIAEHSRPFEDVGNPDFRE